jgi:uncharacterized protein (TIGR03086 family)
MSDISDRYRRVAAEFTAKVRGVPEGAWDNPAPCEGWVAQDVVRHLVEWMPGLYFATAGLPVPELPSADDDPVGAWVALDRALQAALDDPEIATRAFDSPIGPTTVEGIIDMTGTNDILTHTWDLARATGQDERLLPDEVHRVYEASLPYDEVLRQSGHYGPKVAVPDDADEQTKLIAFTGRQP